MVVLAVVLVALASLITTGTLLSSSSAATFNMFGTSVTAAGALVFLAGMAVGIVFLIGLAMLTSGMKRGHRRRVELRKLRSRASSSMRTLEKEKQSLAKEKEELAKRLERERGKPGHAARA